MATIFVDSAEPEAKNGLVNLVIKSGEETFAFVMTRHAAHYLNAHLRMELETSVPEVLQFAPKTAGKAGRR